MPIFDRACHSCGWKRDDCFEPHKCDVFCPACGARTERVWASRPAAVHGDDQFIGGKTFEHLGHEPVTVHSRSELKRELDKRGLEPFVRHQPDQGSDKSKHTTKWY
jgi:hypothetical protein